MKNKLILLIVAVFNCYYAFAQNDADTAKHPGVYSTGNIVNGKKEGAWIYYRNGNIIRTSYFKSDTLVKRTLIFFDSGELAKSIPFENGTISGNVNFYSRKGELVAIYLYKYGGFDNTIMKIVDVDTPPMGHAYNPLDDY